MNLMNIIIVIVVVGVLLGLINSMVPMEAKVKSILNCVVIIALVIFLLKAFHLWDYLSRFHV